MKSPFWTPYLSDHTVKAICWTLVHSLWIGLAISLAAGLVITLTRRSTAALRYNLLCGILAVFALSVGITFLYEMQMPAAQQSTPVQMVHIAYTSAQSKSIDLVPVAKPQQGIADEAVNFLNGYSGLIFTAWLLLFTFKSLKMAGGLLYIRRIRGYKVHEVPKEFNQKIKSFAGQLGIRRRVRLMQSELVKVPVAVGWLKPMVLLPVGIMLQLSPGQLDSILWHELAHIRRRDYLVNILQGVLETFFFFNPGLLWLSSLLRAEREACCDDMVLQRTSRKANYLEALLACGMEGNNRLSLAMGIGSGNQLRDRLKRMVNQENKRLSAIEKVALIIGLIALSAFARFPHTSQVAVKELVNMAAHPKKILQAPHNLKALDADTLARTVLSEKTGQTVTASSTFKKDTTLHFSSILFKQGEDIANNDINAQDVSGKEYHFVTKNNELTSVEVNGQKVAQADFYQYQRILWQIQKEIAEKRHISDDDRARTDAIAAIKANAKVVDKRSQMNQVQVTATDRVERLTVAKEDKLSADLQRVSNVISSLVAERVVPNAESVKWFGLTDTELIVNGQQQSEELRRRLAAKYGVVKNYGLFYGPVEMTGTGVFIDADDQHRREGHRKAIEDHVAAIKAEIARARDDEQAQRVSVQEEKTKVNRARDEHASADVMAKIDQVEQRRRGQSPFDMGTNMQADINSVIADLVNAKVINDRSGLLRFNLTNAALMVNGKKVPEDIHQRLKAKYLQKNSYSTMSDIDANPYFGLHYNAQTGNQGIGITSGPDSP